MFTQTNIINLQSARISVAVEVVDIKSRYFKMIHLSVSECLLTTGVKSYLRPLSMEEVFPVLASHIVIFVFLSLIIANKSPSLSQPSPVHGLKMLREIIYIGLTLALSILIGLKKLF